MSKAAAASIIAVGMVFGTTALCAFWAIGFQAATFQGRTTSGSIAAIDSAASVAGLLFISTVSVLALFIERQFRRPSHGILAVLRWVALTVAVGSICVVLGLAALQFGHLRALTAPVDILVDLARRLACYF